MKNLLAGIMSKFTGSTVSTNVGGRIYLDRASDSATFPNIVFSIVAGTQADTFTDKIHDVLIQFSLFSIAPGLLEIGTMYDNLITLFDNATFTVTGDTLVSCQRVNTMTMLEDITTSGGSTQCRHWAVDYRMVVKD